MLGVGPQWKQGEEGGLNEPQKEERHQEQIKGECRK